MVRIFGQFVPRISLALCVVEALLVSALIYVQFLAPGSFGATQTSTPIALSFAVSLSVIFLMYSGGLYLDDALADTRMLVLRSLPVLGLILLLGAATIPTLSASDPLQYSLYALPGTWLICLLTTRPIFRWMTVSGLFRRRVLILGDGAHAHRLIELAKKPFKAKFLVVGQTDLKTRVLLRAGSSVAHVQLNGAINLGAMVRETSAHEIVVAADDRRGLPVEELLRCKLAGVTVTEYLDFYERETGRVDVEALKPSWLIFSDGFRAGRLVAFNKRAFDIVAALLIFAATLPVLALTAFAIWCEGGGQILYRQERVGLGGRTFTLLKFRSMVEDSEVAGTPVWAAQRDPRITRVGWLIRKLRIDELPQLYNVLRGEMSIVGPRPERPFFVNRLAKHVPFYLERHSVRPGLTGWAQVNYPYGASIEDAREKLSYDLYYLKNRRLLFDLMILIRTLRVVFWLDGSR